MDDIYMLSDTIIFSRIGSNLKAARLKQNITQQSLADAADISLSSLKKIEKGEIGSFDSLLRVLRTLGKLDVFQPLVDEEQLVHTKNQALAINRRCFYISIHSFNACRSITSACRGSPSADRSIASASKSIAFTFSSEKCLISIKILPYKGDLEGLFVPNLPKSSSSRMNTGLSIGR